jgi:hypothetical protein
VAVRSRLAVGLSAAVACGAVVAVTTVATRAADGHRETPPLFHTSDRCIACHNGLTTRSGEDVSIAADWRASMMANSSRDPYWQASVRRETLDHPRVADDIQDECAVCHMPIVRYETRLRGEHAGVLARLPLKHGDQDDRDAADGVSCSVCHQITTERLGTAESFNGGFVVQAPTHGEPRAEYGPFEVEAGHTRIMLSSSEGYRPTQSPHIRQSEMCATCHTLFTQALGADGSVVGRLPEQVPYQEWLHSDFRETQSCQSCHMPAVTEPAPITRVFGRERDGVARHQFVAANFFMLRLLNRYRDALSVAALPQEMDTAAAHADTFLAERAATLQLDRGSAADGRLQAEVVVQNLGGHKLPTAYPSRRAWIHLVVTDAAQRIVFESGALQADGSIRGNDNDENRSAFEPHYTEIQRADQVQIYESILGDANGGVTTGLLTAVRYLKDNRLLPRGFDKRSAEPDIAVQGGAADDPDFVAAGDRIRYDVPIGNVSGPLTITAELLYQPIGFRWATNLKSYAAPESQRFTSYFDSMAGATTATLARASLVVR